MDDKYILLEQYRIYNEAKDRFIDRTFLVNRFYIIFSAVLFISLIAIKSVFVDAYALLLGIELFGIAVSFSWVSNQDAYTSIIKLKYHIVIEGIERQLPASPNKDEYEKLCELRADKKIVLLKDIQKWFAIILMLLFLGNGLLDITGYVLTAFLSIQ